MCRQKIQRLKNISGAFIFFSNPAIFYVKLKVQIARFVAVRNSTVQELA
jgi:hypothetical protein